MRASDAKHSCHSISLSGAPGKTRRNCSRVVSSKIVISSRVSFDVGITMLRTPSRSTSAASNCPVAPPAGDIAVAAMPSRFRTRATLIPPPPGSRWACAHRILVKGTIFLTDVERSTAGLMVRVTIWVNGISANAFNLRQAAQADECGILVQNEIGRNRFEIFAEPPFFLKTRAKSGADEIFGHVTQN